MGGSGPVAGAGGTGETGGTGATGAEAGEGAEGGTAGSEHGPGGAGGSAGDTAGAGGDGPGIAGDGNIAGSGGEGGQVALPCHLDLFNFNADPAGAMGKYLTPSAGPVQSSTVEWSSTDGVGTPPGAGKLNATFGALNEQAQLSLYVPAAPWACTTKLHAKIKIQSATDLSAINGVSFSINSGPYDNTGRYSAQFTSTSTFALDTWYSIELPFATASYQQPANTLPDFNDVRGVGVQLQTKTTGTVPTPVTLFVDDVWVE